MKNKPLRIIKNLVAERYSIANQASYLMQVRRLRELAKIVISNYPIKVKSLDFIKYAANAIFKITDTCNKRYMLRVSPADFHTRSAILEEFEWLNCILRTTEITVPRPVCSDEGKYLIEYKHTEISEPRYCSLFDWVEGRHLWKSINKDYAYNLGILTAQLASSGKQVKAKNRNYWTAEGLVGTDKPRYVNLDHLTGVSKEQQKIITAARHCAYTKLKKYEIAHPSKVGLIHEDLNPNNIIILKNHYGVIDFDDCGIGIYGYDLTAPLFAFEYLTEEDKKKDFNLLKEALYQGYSKYVSLTQEDIDMIPYFLLTRKLTAIAALELRKDNPKLGLWFLNAVERAVKYFKLNKFH